MNGVSDPVPHSTLDHQLTCLQQRLPVVQILDFIAVVLGVRGAGACRTGLCPVNPCKTFGVQLQGFHFGLPREFQNNFPRHNISTAEDGRRVDFWRVQDDLKLFQFIEYHPEAFVVVFERELVFKYCLGFVQISFQSVPVCVPLV